LDSQYVNKLLEKLNVKWIKMFLTNQGNIASFINVLNNMSMNSMDVLFCIEDKLNNEPASQHLLVYKN